MVAIIHGSKSIRATLNYNEHKVAKAQAQCIAVGNYPKEVGALTFLQKYNRLSYQAALNEKVKVNGVHISLNFELSERIPTDKMIAIAQSYMQQIGFGDQPYLVYNHYDAGHPHVHIVTTNIKADGKRIPLHNLGKNVSEPARKQIEQEFNLVIAGSRKLKEAYTLQPVKVEYGKTDTKRAIGQVIQAVTQQYKFTSLQELNAALKIYNVTAERGLPGSRTYDRRGLVYRVLNEQGQPVGAPVKASSFYFKPTLAALEKKYESHEKDRKAHRQRLKTIIDWSLLGRTLTLDQLIQTLKKENIHIVVRANAAGRIFGLTYVDQGTRCVFNGSDLGKNYTAKGIIERYPDHQAGKISASQAVDPEPVVPERISRSKIQWLEQWQHSVHPPEGSAHEPFIGKKKKKRRRPKL